jgi:small subunit ribosomal protein S3
MARQETQKMGSIPLHTLEADVDYATATARTTYGAIGIKVWIYRGKFGEEIERTERRPQRRRPGSGRGRPYGAGAEEGAGMPEGASGASAGPQPQVGGGRAAEPPARTDGQA